MGVSLHTSGEIDSLSVRVGRLLQINHQLEFVLATGWICLEQQQQDLYQNLELNMFSSPKQTTS